MINNTSSSLSYLNRFCNNAKGKSSGKLVIVTKHNSPMFEESQVGFIKPTTFLGSLIVTIQSKQRAVGKVNTGTRIRPSCLFILVVRVLVNAVSLHVQLPCVAQRHNNSGRIFPLCVLFVK